MTLLRGLDGNVLVTPRVAEWFAVVLRRGLDEARQRDGHTIPNAVWDAVDSIETAARASRAQRAGVVGDVVATTPETLSSVMVDPVGGMPPKESTVAEVARLLRVSRQAVDSRCRRGTLPYRVDERGRRLIRLENIGFEGDA